jgi:integrase/recombinase XerC
VPFGRKAAQALNRYIRMRSTYPTASLPNLWLGHAGKALTASGIAQMLRDRGEKVGIEKLHPPLFRHGLDHNWLSDGGTESGLMRIMDWHSRTMLMRYGASAATKHAHEEHRRLQPGDKF